MKVILYTLAVCVLLTPLAWGKTVNKDIQETATQGEIHHGESSLKELDSDAKKQKEKNKDKKKFISLVADPGTNTVLLRWEEVKGAEAYLLKWGESRELLEDAISLDALQIQYFHEGLEPATAYYYHITAKLGKKKETVSKVLKVRTGDREKVKQSDVAY